MFVCHLREGLVHPQFGRWFSDGNEGPGGVRQGRLTNQNKNEMWSSLREIRPDSATWITYRIVHWRSEVTTQPLEKLQREKEKKKNQKTQGTCLKQHAVSLSWFCICMELFSSTVAGIRGGPKELVRRLLI